MRRGSGRWGNRTVGILVVGVAVILIVQLLGTYFVQPKAVMHLAGSRFEIRVADTDRTRIKGLSGTSDLPADQAMVFIFDHDSKWPIWMKDMNYSIDIVWLDSSRQVVDFVTEVPPSSYPNKSFLPRTNARYVVELKSGIVMEKGIKVGQEATFSGTSREI